VTSGGGGGGGGVGGWQWWYVLYYSVTGPNFVETKWLILVIINRNNASVFSPT
jgi:hypothetical protein